MKYLKVKVGKIGKFAEYPNFNSLKAVQDSGLDWAYYIDTYGHGWHFDKTSGHNDDTVGSPKGQQWGMIVAPDAFVTQAVAAFPGTCTELSDLEAKDFYENKVTVYDDSQVINSIALSGIKAKNDLGVALTAEQLKAIDPSDPTPGIVTNDLKTWAGYKTKKKL